MEGIILAGGLGTRLRSVVSGMPKSMADISGRPFLSYVFDYWIKQGVTKFYLLVSYFSEQIVEFYGSTYSGIPLEYIFEESPMGTGGALKNAAYKFKSNEPYLVINGDTIFAVDLEELIQQHNKLKSQLTIGLFKSDKTGRYDQVVLGENKRIVGFGKNLDNRKSYISAGVYIANNEFFSQLFRFKPTLFSLEEDYISKKYQDEHYYGFYSDSKFIDIGTPEDYELFKLIKNRFI